jgi:hypothetical protein
MLDYWEKYTHEYWINMQRPWVKKCRPTGVCNKKKYEVTLLKVGKGDVMYTKKIYVSAFLDALFIQCRK